MVHPLVGILQRAERGGGFGPCGGPTAGADRCSSSTPGTKRFGGQPRPPRVSAADRELPGAPRSVPAVPRVSARGSDADVRMGQERASGGGARSSADVHHAQHRCLRAVVRQLQKPVGTIVGATGAERPRVRPLSASRVESLTARLADRTGADDRSRTRNLLFTKQLLCQLSYVGWRLGAARQVYAPAWGAAEPRRPAPRDLAATSRPLRRRPRARRAGRGARRGRRSRAGPAPSPRRRRNGCGAGPGRAGPRSAAGNRARCRGQ